MRGGLHRRLAGLLLAAVALVGGAAPPGTLAASGGTITQTRLPARVPGASAAILLHVPSGAGALEGRVLLSGRTHHVLAVAVLGPRPAGASALPLRVAAGGARFAVVGLDGRRATTIAVILAPLDPMAAPRMPRARVVVETIGDANGRAIGRAAAIGAGARRPPLAMPRDVLPDGRITRRDVDAVRAAWVAASADDPCGATLARGGLAGRDARRSDANGDGCLDALDLQVLLAARGTRVGPRVPRRTGPAARAARAAAPAGVDHAFSVTSTADTPDAAPGDGICADAGGHCTLRAAIAEADALAGDDLVTFALPGTAPVPIAIGSALPVIASRAGTLTIDGYSQPGSRVNTATHRSNAIPGVELRGAGVDTLGYGLYLTSGGNTIRGLVINGVRHGVFLDGPDAAGNQVLGTWIGMSRSGGAVPRGRVGVLVGGGAHDNRIGTPARADRNVIGHQRTAILLDGEGVTGNIIHNALLCMGPDGKRGAICNVGVDLQFGAQDNVVGGTGPGERVVVGPTNNQAIELSHAWDPAAGAWAGSDERFAISGNRIIGNWLGFRADGSHRAAFRSGQRGDLEDDGNAINLTDGPTHNLISDNVIAATHDGIGIIVATTRHNTIEDVRIGRSPKGEAAPLSGWAVRVRQGARDVTLHGLRIWNAKDGGVGLVGSKVDRVRITDLQVRATRGPAIDLFGRPGPDANDAGDRDAGANTLINSPVITSATTRRIRGTARPGMTVEVVRASRAAGGYGLPVKRLGTVVAGTDGRWSLVVTGVRAGWRVSAIGTSVEGRTSELARNRTVRAA